MRIAVVTDAWAPQLNGVVTVLVELRERLLAMGHEVEVVEPSAFRTFGLSRLSRDPPRLGCG